MGVSSPRCSAPPNKRLKLAGLSLLRESEWLCPDGHELSFNDRCAGGRVAPQLKPEPLGRCGTGL